MTKTEKNINNKTAPNEGNIAAPKTRRDFLKTAWKTLGVVAGLELTGFTVHYLSRQSKVNNKNIFNAGLIDEFPNGSVTPFRQGHFYLVRLKDSGFMAFSIKCTHLGCSILWDENANEFFCPCHSSRFEINGDVKSPPAPRALDIFKIEIEAGEVKVNLSKKIKRDNFNKSQIVYA